MAVRTLPTSLIQQFRDKGRRRDVAARTILIHAGDDSTDVFFVERGRVRFTLVSASGREPILSEIGEGRLFGELAAIDGQPRAAMASAQTDCTLWILDRAAFLDILKADWDCAHWVLGHMADMLRRTTERNFQLSTMTVRTRLACELFDLAAQSEAEVLALPTHADIAARIGTHREAVTRELGKMVKQGVVERVGRGVRICDVAALHDLVEE